MATMMVLINPSRRSRVASRVAVPVEGEAGPDDIEARSVEGVDDKQRDRDVEEREGDRRPCAEDSIQGFVHADVSRASRPCSVLWEKRRLDSSSATATGGTPVVHHAVNRFTMIVSFCPPKPKELDMATSHFAWRALLGT